MKKLLDLRFVIGIFFLTIGILLIGYHNIATIEQNRNESVNIYTGITFSIFGLIMLVLSLFRTPKED